MHQFICCGFRWSILFVHENQEESWLHSQRESGLTFWFSLCERRLAGPTAFLVSSRDDKERWIPSINESFRMMIQKGICQWHSSLMLSRCCIAFVIRTFDAKGHLLSIVIVQKVSHEERIITLVKTIKLIYTPSKKFFSKNMLFEMNFDCLSC